jgi:alkanesulfonate monooxygenase SsuD/methylene tetrahydromethanopterin reductase-like flavin-dependent oxidoreductase (luciferase family)
VKFAHFTQTFPREGETAADRYDQMWRELELADQVNFDYGFSSVHHFSRLRPTSSTYCTGAAARTKRLRLGPMGYTVGLYNPIRLVEEVALLDNITHGRLEVGLTTGVTPEEFRIYGGDWDERHSVATEAMQLLRKAFTSGDRPFTFEGPHHQYHNVPLAVEPLQQPHPPIWLLSMSPTQLQAAAQEGAHTGYVFFRRREEAAPSVAEYLRMWQQYEHPYNPNVAYVAFVYVDETDEKAAETAAPHLLHSMRSIYGRAMGVSESNEVEYYQAGTQQVTEGFNEDQSDRLKWYDFDYLHQNTLVFVGSPQTVAEKLHDASATGLFNVYCGEFNIGHLPEEDLMRSIRLFGTEVIPALKDFDSTIKHLS